MNITLNGTEYAISDIDDIYWEDTTSYTDATEFTITFRDGTVEVVHVDDLEDDNYERLLQFIDPM
ncbi:MAG: hypothetical protein KME49_27460 [Brasilonema octagenarum HA4186-MV1]|jgi:FtsZ-interacting cell division protein YlmF|nr:hypothetical protein [Brasilonema octagenarum HA4186-MV1]